jgi:hypothetical protein
VDQPDNDGRGNARPPTMPFWEMKSGLDGRSTIDRQALDDFVRQSVSGSAAPSWMRAFCGTVETVFFNVLPAGWVGEWHPSPALQWVVPLSGRWFIETQDGKRVDMGPGDIHWGADVAHGERSTIAHRSGVIGDAPCVQLMLQFDAVADAAVSVPG